MIDSGWIKVYRQLTENEIWKIKPFSKGQAWIDLLVLTNHAPDLISAKNGQIISVSRGECGWSALALAQRWGWSRGKVFRFFEYLSGMKMVQQKIIANHTILVICNYESFQGDTINESINRTTNGQQTGQQTDTNKNDKKVQERNNTRAETMKKLLSPEALEEWNRWQSVWSELHNSGRPMPDGQLEGQIRIIAGLPQEWRVLALSAAADGGWKQIRDIRTPRDTKGLKMPANAKPEDGGEDNPENYQTRKYN